MLRAFVTGIGLVTPAGSNTDEHLEAFSSGKSFIKNLSLFEFDASDQALPAGEIDYQIESEPGLPRTHILALKAAKEALGNNDPPDAVIVGSTTGGIFMTEQLLKDGNKSSEAYSLHGTGTIAGLIAQELKCTGPALTVSTACSSGAVAIKAALEMIRSGRAYRILAGGADSLCRLTFNGFYSLQLIDQKGCRPFDRNRLGMTVGEGAGFLLLEASDMPPENAVAELLGGALSCDAYHATKPHPEGEGAVLAMRRCLEDAGLNPSDVDYINLHGTGTLDNDAVEAKAVVNVFGEKCPYMSSTKGLAGHSLAASGAIEAAFACLAVKEGFIPPNIGLTEVDESLGIVPAARMLKADVRTALSNSFGFGGNNASVAFGKPRTNQMTSGRAAITLKIKGLSCITGAGHTRETFSGIEDSVSCSGKADIGIIARDLPARQIRRLGRLSQMALAVAAAAHRESGIERKPSQVFFGTGWGGLSETYDFLDKIFTSGGKFGSPTDFVGSVHNAPAGQAALFFGAKGANVTATSGDASFEQALLMTELLISENGGDALLICADEYHDVLTPILDRSETNADCVADGAAAFLISAETDAEGPIIKLAFTGQSTESGIDRVINSLGCSESINSRFAAIFAGIPAAETLTASGQLKEFLASSSFAGTVLNYRKLTGEFASASAVAAVIGAEYVRKEVLPSSIAGEVLNISGKGILLLGLGSTLSAVEILPDSKD
jgi:3-oxoacyl-(acyl-carrier-protein) synthase